MGFKMEIVEYFICPSCKGSYKKRQDAIICKNRHEIKSRYWVYCRCGEGWSVDAYGVIRCKEYLEKHLKQCKGDGDFAKKD